PRHHQGPGGRPHRIRQDHAGKFHHPDARYHNRGHRRAPGPDLVLHPLDRRGRDRQGRGGRDNKGPHGKMVKDDMAMTELIYFAIFYILCCFIAIWRLIKGPTAPDRAVAGDCVDVLTDMALVLVAMYSGRGIYLDIAIVT